MFVHLLLDEVFDAVRDLVGPQRFLNDHLLEHVQFLFPLPWERDFAWVLVGLDHLELFQVVHKIVSETFEAFDGIQAVYIFVDDFP